MVAPKADTVVTIDGYTYSLNQYGMAVLVGWDNSSETLYVPHYIGNVPVAEIGDSAFKDDDFIKTLDLSDANRMYHIGEFSFANSALSGELVIPSRVTYVGVAAFQDCDSLSEVRYSSDGGAVSAQCFMGCDSLSSVVLTEYIKSIRQYAFKDCPSLGPVYIPASVSSIDDTAFIGSDNVVINCYAGSYAEQYALEHGMSYVIIEISQPTEPPTEAPTDAPNEVRFILGDADGDGKISILDATKIQRLLADLITDPDGMIALRGDCSENGLDILDATKIQRRLADLSVAEPIGEEVTRVIPAK